MKDLEREILELQELAGSTGEREHFNVLKRKKITLSNL